MSLRRTALVRKTGLRRTPLRRGVRERAARVRRSPRDTGPSAGVRALVYARAGYRCEVCGCDLTREWSIGYSVHHRQPRGMGGTSRLDVNSPANLLLVCGSGTTGCHGEIERHRASAYAFGWLVRRPQDPAVVPVSVESVGWVLLTGDGGYVLTEAPS